MFASPGHLAFQIGPVNVHWYGIIIGLGIILSYIYALFEAKRRGLDRKPIDDMAFWVILAGVIGARGYYVLFNLPYFFENPLEIFFLWRGGLAIHGALIGGAAAYFIYIKLKKIHWLLYADVIMPGILLAQALGRWGNFFNSEAFGRPTDLAWKLFIPFAKRPQGFEGFEFFHPTFLYESIWNLIGFIVLVFLSRKLFATSYKLQATSFYGIILFIYFIWYSIGRFFIESLRMDSLYLGPLRAAQVMSIVLFIIGLVGLIYKGKKASQN
ncbi:prolipoprotein diacylglyceryl transferase [Candidatus Peregrinibacteria bacterium]|nr:prolipoprotein diacylglyceryl transferase [Candidatus Peregrinibacteria bacterium]